MIVFKTFGYTLVNGLTGFRFLAAYMIVQSDYGLSMACWALAAAVADLFDGIFARLFRCESVIGEHLDPLADKFLAWAGFYVILNFYAGSPLIWLSLLPPVAFICSYDILTMSYRTMMLLSEYAPAVFPYQLKKVKTSKLAKGKTFVLFGALVAEIIFIAPDFWFPVHATYGEGVALLTFAVATWMTWASLKDYD